MAKKIDPRLIEILTKYEEDPKEALWDCHGTWVAYHKAIERIAAKSGIEYDAPQVLVAERDAAAILVIGKLDGKTEWSIGEAAINLNYRVSGKQAAYPFAMAEKRAKDRVVLKLIGLHGLVYSEEESDDFKQGQQPEPAQESQKPSKRPETRTLYSSLQKSLRENTSRSDLKAWWKDAECVAQRKLLPEDWQKTLYDEFVHHGSSLPEEQKEAA